MREVSVNTNFDASFLRLSMPVYRCEYCGYPLPTEQGVKSHIQLTPACRDKRDAELLDDSFCTFDTLDDDSQHHHGHGPDLPAFESPPNIDYTHEEDFTHRSKRARVEEVEDEEVEETRARCFVQQYPGIVAQILRSDKTLFEQYYDLRKAAGVSEWAPFEDKEEWELARWLIQSVGQNRIDEFLKLPIVR